MADKNSLEAAAAAGVISQEQAAALQNFMAAEDAGVQPTGSGEENLRFIRNFHDVFLAIGIAMVGIGMGVAIASIVAGGGMENVTQGATMIGALSLGAAAVMWVLGELFARRRRLFLPAIAIVLGFTWYIFAGVASLYFGVLLGQEPNFEISQGLPPEVRTGILIVAASVVLAPAAFYARFRLPFSIGLTGGAAAAFIVLAIALFAIDTILPYLAALYLVVGALLFLAGVAFDARDPMRTTRFSDNGFWLHFAAAPFILGGAFGLVGLLFGAEVPIGGMSLGVAAAADAENAVAQAIVTLLVVFVLGFISLLINRRALIVSALLTTAIALGIILREFGLGAGSLAAAVLLSLGAFVLILGAGWAGVRRALLGWVKPDGFWARIFPPANAPS